MKTINVIIIGLVAAVAFSTYLLMSKMMPAPTTPEPSAVPAASEKQPMPAQAPVAVQQPRLELPAAQTQPPHPQMTRQEAPVVQPQPQPAPPVKEEPKLRPVRDIKVVMYMTDW